jgi:hypothetical protein
LKPHILELKRSFPPKNATTNEEDGEVIKHKRRTLFWMKPIYLASQSGD